MNEFWNTGWDPHEVLIQCQQNIQQCAMAINHSTEVMKDLAQKYNHQQEVIQQLMFQNRKLQGIIDNLKTQISVQSLQITAIEHKLPQ